MEPASVVPKKDITMIEDSNKEKALEAGCDDYDTKPVEFKRLLGKINSFLEKNNS